jgi:hypothetical protein
LRENAAYSIHGGSLRKSGFEFGPRKPNSTLSNFRLFSKVNWDTSGQRPAPQI